MDVQVIQSQSLQTHEGTLCGRLHFFPSAGLEPEIILEQILLGESLHRSDVTAGLEVLTLIALGVVVTLVMSFSGPLLSILSGGGAAAVVIGGSWYAFTANGILFDAAYPLVMGLVNFGVLVAYQFIVAGRDKRMIRRSFAQYVSPAILREIEDSGHHLALGGEMRDVTVMFCDIRNFTPLAESMSAHDLVDILNDLFSELGDEILSEKGTIDKFIGDSIMAFWNAPLPVENHKMHAAHAAIRMRTALAKFNEGLVAEGRAAISCAIGCATGIACVGNIGSRQRFNYTVIGDTVNAAARIEASCRQIGYDIVVSDEIIASSTEQLATLEAGSVSLKGKSARLRLHVVVGGLDVVSSPAYDELRQAHFSLISKMQSNGENLEPEFANCVTLAERLEPGLVEFYRKMPLRREDFQE